MITTAQAHHVMSTMEDVFAPDDDGDMMAGVVDKLYTFVRPLTHPLYGKGQCARITGEYHRDRWVPLSQIELSDRSKAPR